MASLRRSPRLAPAPLKAPRFLREMECATNAALSALDNILQLIQQRAAPGQPPSLASTALHRARWAIADALEYKMRPRVLVEDQATIEAVPCFVSHLRSVTEQVNRDADRFGQYRVLSPSLLQSAIELGNSIHGTF